MNQALVKSLSAQSQCPACGVSWDAIQDDLETAPIGSYALDQAIGIVVNCTVCRERFAGMLTIILKLAESRRLNKPEISFEGRK